MAELLVHVRYIGDDVVTVPGAGVFQHGTEAFVSRDTAWKLLESDEWLALGRAQPAVQLLVRVGQMDTDQAPPPPEHEQPTEPADPSWFGDLPPEGPEADEDT